MIARPFPFARSQLLAASALLLSALSTGGVAGAEDPAAVVVDLSQDLEDATNINSSPGAIAVNAVASNDTYIRTALVLENGKIVASYARSDVDPDEPFHCWSTTKSWMSMLTGFMVQDGLLSVNDTLGDVFQDDDVWSNATDPDFRKAVTIRELLTMSSGLISPPSDMPSPDATPEEMAEATGALLAAAADGGVAGGATLEGSLAYPEIGEKGVFSYLGISNIMSYVLLEKTGMTPRQYLAEKALPDLGIDDADINWWQNADGIEFSYHGIGLTPRQMAKFGQLYLQDGKSSPDKQLISSEWVAESLTRHLTFAIEPVPGIRLDASYGYLFWSGANETDFLGVPDIGNVWCAFGAGGQDICIDTAKGRVSVQQRDFENSATEDNRIIAAVALNPGLSFQPDEKGEEASAVGEGGEEGGGGTTSTNGDTQSTMNSTEATGGGEGGGGDSGGGESTEVTAGEDDSGSVALYVSGIRRGALKTAFGMALFSWFLLILM